MESFSCNSVIEGLENSSKLSPGVRTELLGEAKFMRAFFYFYLTNLFGDVPLLLTSDYKHNSSSGKSSTTAIYSQMIADLQEAQSGLSTEYMDGQLKPYNSIIEKLRPNRWAATALLARVYLYNNDFINAEKGGFISY